VAPSHRNHLASSTGTRSQTLNNLECHRHYLSSGQIDRAVERVIKLAKVAPNLSGVADVIIRLASVSDDLELAKMNEQLKRSSQ
jgi:hypothetical protein